MARKERDGFITWKSGGERRADVHERRIAQIATLMTAATIKSVTSAYKQRLAHLSSAVRMRLMMTWRSASVFSGSHAADGVAAGGARRGDSRMTIPNIQKGGNTGFTCQNFGDCT